MSSPQQQLERACNKHSVFRIALHLAQAPEQKCGLRQFSNKAQIITTSPYLFAFSTPEVGATP